MNEVKKIIVSPNATTLPQRLIGQIGFWLILVAAVGWSRIWFGGAFVIDLAALVLCGTWLFVIVGKNSGTHVEMSENQIRHWVADGCPLDAKTWKAKNYD